MKEYYWIVLLVVAWGLASCGPNDFQLYSSSEYAKLVEEEFESREDLAHNRSIELFDVERLTINLRISSRYRSDVMALLIFVSVER